MKASLFAEDEEEDDMFQDPVGMKVSTDISSPRLIVPGAQSRPSGKENKPFIDPHFDKFSWSSFQSQKEDGDQFHLSGLGSF